jgi:hypothetical protein
MLKDVMHLFVYCIVFLIVFSNYGHPLHPVSWGSDGSYEGEGSLLQDMMHLFVYCIFFVIVFSNYGHPLHQVRWVDEAPGELSAQLRG